MVNTKLAPQGGGTKGKEEGRMKKKKCKGNHKGHLCVLASAGQLEEIRDLAANPAFICFNCGRPAKSKKNLCNPMLLKAK